jgi:hypothetical protein
VAQQRSIDKSQLLRLEIFENRSVLLLMQARFGVTATGLYKRLNKRTYDGTFTLANGANFTKVATIFAGRFPEWRVFGAILSSGPLAINTGGALAALVRPAGRTSNETKRLR